MCISPFCCHFLSCLHPPPQHGGSFSEKPKQNGGEGASSGGSSDDYAYPPPPVPAYSLSLPNSPLLYRKGPTGGHSRNVPTPGRSPSSSCTGTNPLRAHTAPSSPAPRRPTREQGVCTLPSAGRQNGGQTNKRHEQISSHHCSTAPRQNGCQKQAQQTQNEQRANREHPELAKQRSIDELRCTVQTPASGIEHGADDVRQLGRKMVAATAIIAHGEEENAQALKLLAEVVDKLQGLIVAGKVTPPRRAKQPPPPPPPRVSSMSPKAVRKPPTPYPRHIVSSSSSCSSSSSSTSGSSCAGPKRVNGGSERTAVTFGGAHRAGGAGSNVQARLNDGAASRAPLEDQQDGLLHPGDLLVEVNGNPVVGLEPEQLIQILINSQGTILFKVIPDAGQSSGSQTSVFMKAMVDYCPLQDSSIPCPDAGMAFSRGDVLEVVDQSDGHWWQARKLPCSAACAGLIPSASMLKR
ncbi:hypothetical protein PFLUV_G00150110 [Perca fluviatilis]|uniref:SH3 domain-containing protein n=1 Tax=Perca fluviatilis TaxID=8168 RepID=A0A6A5EXE6_PERFL|nr:hypothetical protein PFLUV_G00150110 [Perca fluviatilis]